MLINQLGNYDLLFLIYTYTQLIILGYEIVALLRLARKT